jgi:hypothetical protein
MEPTIQKVNATYHWRDGTELIVTAKGFDVYGKGGRHLFSAKEN